MKSRPFQLIETNGIRLRAVVEGEGPLVVFVHGWPESWYSWRHQLDPVREAGYRVIALDVRGYGGSDKPQPIEAYSLKELTADVAGVIAAFGGGPAILVGHDWGAPIVWTTAILYRSQVRAVAGLSVPYLGRPRRPAIELFRRIYTERGRFFYQVYFQEPGVAEQELEADIPLTLRKTYYCASGELTVHEAGLIGRKAKDAKFLDEMLDPSPLPKWLTEEDVAYYAEQFRGSGFRGPLNRYRNSERDWEELPALETEKITQPALFVAGERDPVLSFVPGRTILDVMDPFYQDLRKKVLVPGIGHWVQQEAPEVVTRELLEFLAQV
jgi:pimeloyl-ACP methyl ester carboxylesterase